MYLSRKARARVHRQKQDLLPQRGSHVVAGRALSDREAVTAAWPGWAVAKAKAAISSATIVRERMLADTCA